MITILSQIYIAFMTAFYKLFDTSFIANNADNLFNIALGFMFSTTAVFAIIKFFKAIIG